MVYRLGIYKNHQGKEFNLNELTYEEAKTFRWLQQEYDQATSWDQFQERTAPRVKELAFKMAEQWKRRGHLVSWEEHIIYQIRFDMLRNVGIRTGELKGELSDMIISEVKE